MAKGKFATAVFLVLASFAAYAQPGRSDDGCALLGQLVRNSVHLAATQFGLESPRQRLAARARSGVAPAVANRKVCRNTTEAATRAFREAIAGLNMSIRWNAPMDRGDYCLSHKLSQCYPGWEPGDPVPGNQLAFVHDAWKGVRRGVESQMPFGGANGVSQFTAESLDAALAAQLSETVDGPLYSSYSGFDAGRARR
jgi:hypothetical protein